MYYPEYIENCDSLKHYSRIASELTVDDDLVLKSNRIVIPAELQNHVISLAHLGHLGIVKTKGLLRTKVYFPNLDKLVENYLAKCVACKSVITKQQRPP